MNKVRILTGAGLAILLAGGVGWVVLSESKIQRKILPEPVVQQVNRIMNRTRETPALSEEEQNEKIRAGNLLVRQSLQSLLHRSSFLTADVLQILQTPDQSFRASGQYWQGPGVRTRLSLEFSVGDVDGRMLQVSDGQVIWDVKDMTPHPGQEQDEINRIQIHRVDTTRLRELSPEDMQELGVMHGGLPGLLLTLVESLDFQVIREASVQESPCFVLEGSWKPAEEIHSVIMEADGAFPQGRPDKVRLFLRQTDLFPIRYLCLSQHPDRSGLYAPLAMELSNVNSNAVVKESVFVYRPPEDHIPNDITHEYIARLSKAGKDSDEQLK